MEKSELNIRALLFIESTHIGVCFMEGQKFNEISKKLDSKLTVDKNKYVITNKKYCPHKKLPEIEYNKLKKKGKLNKNHCNRIKDFADKFSQYYQYIMREIANYFFDDCHYVVKNKDISGSAIAIADSVKEILDIYMNYVTKIVKNHPLFNNTPNDSNDYEDEMAIKEKQEKDKEKV